MTIHEFRCWLEGFSESIAEAPTALQWARIQERLKSVGDGGTVIAPGRYSPALGIGYPPVAFGAAAATPDHLRSILTSVGRNVCAADAGGPSFKRHIGAVP